MCVYGPPAKMVYSEEFLSHSLSSLPFSLSSSLSFFTQQPLAITSVFTGEQLVCAFLPYGLRGHKERESEASNEKNTCKERKIVCIGGRNGERKNVMDGEKGRGVGVDG